MNAVLLALVLSAPDAGVQPLVEVVTRIPDAVVDLRYATADNFMGKAVYPPEARLLLEKSASRPRRRRRCCGSRGSGCGCTTATARITCSGSLWKVLPKPGYVADPKTGSNHNRGGAIDLSLVRLDGGVVEMPSPYDFFGKAAHHSFDGGEMARCSGTARR